MRDAGPSQDAKRRLLRAGERLFAEQGIHRVRLRELHELAGQRNASALHYHFGTRNGLVDAILAEHMRQIDAAIHQRLDAISLGGDPDVRQVIEAIVPTLAAKLLDKSGRYFLRIVPQLLPQLSKNFRRGRFAPASPESARLLELLERAMRDHPEPIRRERLVSYTLMLITLLADRANGLDRGHDMVLDHDAFVANLIDTLTGALTYPGPAPTKTLGSGSGRRRRAHSPRRMRP